MRPDATELGDARRRVEQLLTELPGPGGDAEQLSFNDPWELRAFALAVAAYPTTGVWDVDSIGLVEILSRLNRGEDQAGSPIGQPAGFTIACALDPTAADSAAEWDRLERKLAAGADLVMTQPLYGLGQVEAMFG